MFGFGIALDLGIQAASAKRIKGPEPFHPAKKKGEINCRHDGSRPTKFPVEGVPPGSISCS